MAKKKREQPGVPVLYHPDADDELHAELDAATVADVVDFIDSINGKTHQEIVARLDGRTERKIFQWETSHRAGTLRVAFAWGRGCLWFIGAFVKVNNAEGERYMSHIRPRAEEVREAGPGEKKNGK